MKNTSLMKRLLLPVLGAVAFCSVAVAEKLVILHTNDTHSTIDALPDGRGGVLARKAIIDSVRQAEKNVILVDAGDIVQGTTYFKFFKGEVEYPLMDMMGYEIRVLGNHEFDNGMESLSKYYQQTKGTPLSANYDFSGTELDSIFQPYVVKEYDGKKIGFIGINLDPESIIAHKNIDVKFSEVIPVANEIAGMLKNEEGCDLVAVVSHIGYNSVNEKTADIDLAQASENIDLIIGGHTHTLIDPLNPDENPSLIENSAGRNVRIAQTGKQGLFLGKITIDLDNLPIKDGKEISYELIPVTERFEESKLDQDIISFLTPFREAVDSINNVVIGYCAYDLEKERTGGLPNLTADISFNFGKTIADSLRSCDMDFPEIDLSIMNVGGIRHEMKKGPITEGQILSTYPFSNKFVIVALKGEDIIEAMRISAMKGGEAISENLKVLTDENGLLKQVLINGAPMDPEKEYVVCTIDYIAEGNDDLVSMANHRKLFEIDREVAVPVMLYIKNLNSEGKEVSPDLVSRFVME